MIYLCKDIYCRYGASETGLMARASAREVLSRPGFAGHVLPGIEVAVIDRNGKTCRRGEVGLVRSRRDPRWHAAAKTDDEGWVNLRDVGWINEEGELYVIGRVTDMAELNSKGIAAQKISPIHEVEHLLRLEWDATDAAAIFASDASTAGAQSEIWVGTVDCKDASADKFEAILRARGINTPVRLFPLKSIPRSANGKVQRAELRSMIFAASSETRGS
jgi:acyl-coenzyme A synthetase/AMP-(fatty) acid ligase